MASETTNNPKSVFPLIDSSVDVAEGALWKNDCANRKPFAANLTKIIDGIGAEKSKVLLLDGEWGSGKTYFLKSLRYQLKEQGYRAIYFDAYEEDFSVNPLAAICGQLWGELSIKGNAAKMKKVLAEFMSLAGKELLKNYTGISPEMVSKASDTMKKKEPSFFVEYSKSKEGLQELKGNLSSIVKERSGGNPLVFIIDELDRCRPTFALELLERVKHLFDVAGVIFIFGANKKSLMESIRSQYGKQSDSYLHKFFDFDLKLPDVPPSTLAVTLFGDFSYLVEIDRGVELKHYEPIMGLYCRLIDLMGFHYRDVQKATQMFQLGLYFVPHGKRRIAPISALACLALLKVKYPALYADIAYEEGECRKVIKELAPLFDKWDDPKSDTCRAFFNRAISYLAMGGEKKILSDKYYENNEFGLDDIGWDWVRRKLDFYYSPRPELVRILDNLGCQFRG